MGQGGSSLTNLFQSDLVVAAKARKKAAKEALSAVKALSSAYGTYNQCLKTAGASVSAFFLELANQPPPPVTSAQAAAGGAASQFGPNVSPLPNGTSPYPYPAIQGAPAVAYSQLQEQQEQEAQHHPEGPQGSPSLPSHERSGSTIGIPVSPGVNSSSALNPTMDPSPSPTKGSSSTQGLDFNGNEALPPATKSPSPREGEGPPVAEFQAMGFSHSDGGGSSRPPFDPAAEKADNAAAAASAGHPSLPSGFLPASGTPPGPSMGYPSLPPPHFMNLPNQFQHPQGYEQQQPATSWPHSVSDSQQQTSTYSRPPPYAMGLSQSQAGSSPAGAASMEGAGGGGGTPGGSGRENGWLRLVAVGQLLNMQFQEAMASIDILERVLRPPGESLAKTMLLPLTMEAAIKPAGEVEGIAESLAKMVNWERHLKAQVMELESIRKELMKNSKKLNKKEKSVVKQEAKQVKQQEAPHQKHRSLLGKGGGSGPDYSKVTRYQQKVSDTNSRLAATTRAVEVARATLDAFKANLLLPQLIRLLPTFLDTWTRLARVHEKQMQVAAAMAAEMGSGMFAFLGGPMTTPRQMATKHAEEAFNKLEQAFSEIISQQKRFLSSLIAWIKNSAFTPTGPGSSSPSPSSTYSSSPALPYYSPSSQVLVPVSQQYQQQQYQQQQYQQQPQYQQPGYPPAGGQWSPHQPQYVVPWAAAAASSGASGGGVPSPSYPSLLYGATPQHPPSYGPPSGSSPHPQAGSNNVHGGGGYAPPNYNSPQPPPPNYYAHSNSLSSPSAMAIVPMQPPSGSSAAPSPGQQQLLAADADPSVQLLSDWLQALQGLPEREVKDSLTNFCQGLKNVLDLHGQELKQLTKVEDERRAVEKALARVLAAQKKKADLHQIYAQMPVLSIGPAGGEAKEMATRDAKVQAAAADEAAAVAKWEAARKDLDDEENTHIRIIGEVAKAVALTLQHSFPSMFGYFSSFSSSSSQAYNSLHSRYPPTFLQQRWQQR